MVNHHDRLLQWCLDLEKEQKISNTVKTAVPARRVSKVYEKFKVISILPCVTADFNSFLQLETSWAHSHSYSPVKECFYLSKL
jgi:hypothetical protein